MIRIEVKDDGSMHLYCSSGTREIIRRAVNEYGRACDEFAGSNRVLSAVRHGLEKEINICTTIYRDSERPRSNNEDDEPVESREFKHRQDVEMQL